MTDAESSTLSTTSSQLNALSSKIDTRMGKLDKFEEKMGLIVSDQEIRAKNEQYLNDLRVGDAKRVALERELVDVKDDLLTRSKTVIVLQEKIGELQGKIGELEREIGEYKSKVSKSHTICVNGESDLVSEIERLQMCYGDGFTFKYTALDKHSGDVICSIQVRKKLPLNKFSPVIFSHTEGVHQIVSHQ